MAFISFNLYWYAEFENGENPFMLIFYFYVLMLIYYF